MDLQSKVLAVVVVLNLLVLLVISGKQATLTYTPAGGPILPHNLHFHATMGRLKSF